MSEGVTWKAGDAREWEGALAPNRGDETALRALARVTARQLRAVEVRIRVRDRWGNWEATWRRSGAGVCAAGISRRTRVSGGEVRVRWPAGARADERSWRIVGALLRVALAGWRRAREQAGWDALTHLPNRRTIEELLRRAWEAAERYGATFAILLADVDNLKQWNDSRGHDAGDRVLVRVARALRRGCRAADVVGRWGGDEFLILLPRTDAAGAATLARRLAARVQRPGLAVGAADSGEVSRGGPRALIRLADRRLREAKQGKRFSARSS